MRLGLLVPIIGWILVPIFIQRKTLQLRQLIKESAYIFGSQCIVIAIDAKRNYIEKPYDDNSKVF